jgi:hypothetical protein
MNATTDDLLRLIGKLTVQNDLLTRENALLRQVLDERQTVPAGPHLRAVGQEETDDGTDGGA